MTVPTDPFLFVNGTTADATQVNARYAPLYAALAGSLDTDNLLDTINELLGLSKGAVKRRGKAIIPTSESRSNAAFGTLPTPDQVTGIVLPTDGLLFVSYQATWQESVNGGGIAALFIGANQVKVASDDGGAPVVQQAGIGAGVGAIDKPLRTCIGGLICRQGNATAYTGDVTTGQILGARAPNDGLPATHMGYCGPTLIFAAAGTYTIGVQFRTGAGSVTVKNRKLWVWTMGF